MVRAGADRPGLVLSSLKEGWLGVLGMSGNYREGEGGRLHIWDGGQGADPVAPSSLPHSLRQGSPTSSSSAKPNYFTCFL